MKKSSECIPDKPLVSSLRSESCLGEWGLCSLESDFVPRIFWKLKGWRVGLGDGSDLLLDDLKENDYNKENLRYIVARQNCLFDLILTLLCCSHQVYLKYSHLLCLSAAGEKK